MPEITVLELRYVLRDKLKSLLENEFGNNYKVRASIPQFELDRDDSVHLTAGLGKWSSD